MVVHCHNCGVGVSRKPSDIGTRVFCGAPCYKEAVSKDKTLNGRYIGSKELPCAQCGKLLSLFPSSPRKFCSRSCRLLWRSVHLVGSKAANYRGGQHNFTCQVCRTEFSSHHKRRVTCSIECKSRMQEAKVHNSCACCGREYVVHASVLKWSKIRGNRASYCSRECAVTSHSGESSPLWISDRSALKSQNKSIRASREMSTWREAVFERDDWVCQQCGARSLVGKALVLNAHHIVPFRAAPELRFDVNNGICLCESCHKTTYGKEATFAEMFHEIVRRKSEEVVPYKTAS